MENRVWREEYKKRFARLLYVVEEIKRKEKTTKSLAQETGVSTRQILRDMGIIQEAGYALYNPQRGVWALLKNDRC